MIGWVRGAAGFVRLGVVVLAVAVALLLVGAVGAQAATFTVNTTVDNAPAPSECSGVAGDCSLRQAIGRSNATTSDDVINVPAGHYTLTIRGANENTDQTGDLDINKATGTVTIVGGGARSTIVDATGLGDRVLKIVAGSAAISGLTITGGSPPENSTPFGGGSVGDGGGIQNNGTLTLTDSTVTGNTTALSGHDMVGGGIANPTATSMTLSGDTFTANHAGAFGGGVDIDRGAASITNTTVASNIADSDSGGVDIDTNLTVKLTNDTLAGNESGDFGGGIGIFAGVPDVSVLNTIVANNTAVGAGTGQCSNGGGGSLPTDLGHNLDTDGSCFTPTSSNGDIRGNPLLGPLGDNGGQTDTMALLGGSPAINAGTNSGCPASDQRGVSRPQGSRCDIGAYEATPPVVVTNAATGVTTTSATVNGAVNPTNLATTYHFEYGTTTAYGSTTASQSAGSDYAAHAEAAAISGLTPGVMYHFRIVATNAVGASFGADRVFSTVGAPVARIASPADHHSFRVGQHVATSFSCTEAAGGPGIASCTDSNGGHAPAGALDTRKAGRFTYTVTARSMDGLSASTNITYTVIAAARVQISGLLASPLRHGCAVETGSDEREITAIGADATCRHLRLVMRGTIEADGKLRRSAGGTVRVSFQLKLPSGRAAGTARANVNGGHWRVSLTLPGVNLDPVAPRYLLTARYSGDQTTAPATAERQIRLEIERAGLNP